MKIIESMLKAMDSEEMEPQIKAPRVTPLKGVSTHGCGHACVRSREPAGFRHDERRLVSLELDAIHNPFNFHPWLRNGPRIRKYEASRRWCMRVFLSFVCCFGFYQQERARKQW